MKLDLSKKLVGWNLEESNETLGKLLAQSLYFTTQKIEGIDAIMAQILATDLYKTGIVDIDFNTAKKLREFAENQSQMVLGVKAQILQAIDNIEKTPPKIKDK